jgi:hypothetical protein
MRHTDKDNAAARSQRRRALWKRHLAREGTPQKDARGTARPNEDIASETPEQRKNL